MYRIVIFFLHGGQVSGRRAVFAELRTVVEFSRRDPNRRRTWAKDSPIV